MSYKKWHDDIELLQIKYNNPKTTGHADLIVEAKVKDHTDGRVKLITYYVSTNMKRYGHEIYSGQNYVVGSHERSYSRNYPKGKGLPDKYYAIGDYLWVLWQDKYAGWRKRA